ncbi:MAG: competence/damage-inducible protein A [Flavobacteriia bacterium]|nr:competence/damage-inducible protein A [Flavobacteriia bacterium]
MNAQIITIGDEILIGQIVDTNATFLAQELNKIGVSVTAMHSIPDTTEDILHFLSQAQDQVDLVLLTGGLGPTKDDVTKKALCEYFEDHLVENTAVLAHIKMLFKKYISTKMNDANLTQALLPSQAIALHNAYGTAPGMWLQKGKTVFVSMPGVPFEMKALMTHQVIPKVITDFQRPFIIHKTIQTYGVGESAIAEDIADFEDALPPHIKLAYLPSLGKVRLRLSAKGEDQKILEAEVAVLVAQLLPLLGDIVYGLETDELIEAVVAKTLTKKGRSLALAESCTGGLLARALTAIPGASVYFKGGVVAYETAQKINLLGVSESLIQEFSVVSEPVVAAMALGVQQSMSSDFAIATTGNAGPTKGDSAVPVGTVCIGIATPNEVFTHTFSMGNHRERIVQKTVNKAFELLQKEIIKF